MFGSKWLPYPETVDKHHVGLRQQGSPCLTKILIQTLSSEPFPLLSQSSLKVFTQFHSCDVYPVRSEV